jgi:hypothetical protein
VVPAPLWDCGSDRARQDERGDGLTVLIRLRVSKETAAASGEDTRVIKAFPVKFHYARVRVE